MPSKIFSRVSIRLPAILVTLSSLTSMDFTHAGEPCGCNGVEACGQTNSEGCGCGCGTTFDYSVPCVCESFMDRLDRAGDSFERSMLSRFRNRTRNSCDKGCSSGSYQMSYATPDGSPAFDQSMATQPMSMENKSLHRSASAAPNEVAVPAILDQPPMLAPMQPSTPVPPALPAADYQHDPFQDDAALQPRFNRYTNQAVAPKPEPQLEAFESPSESRGVRVRIGGDSDSSVVPASSSQRNSEAAQRAVFVAPSRTFRSESNNRYVQPATEMNLAK